MYIFLSQTLFLSQGSRVAFFLFASETYPLRWPARGHACNKDTTRTMTSPFELDERRHLRARSLSDRFYPHRVLRVYIYCAHFRCDLVEILSSRSCNKYRCTWWWLMISFAETSPIPRRAPTITVVGMLTCICFPFSRMGIYTKFGRGRFSLRPGTASGILGGVLSPHGVW